MRRSVVVAVWVDTSALGLGVVAAVRAVGCVALVLSAVAVGAINLVVLVTGCCDGAASVASLVRGAEIVVVASSKTAGSGSSTGGAKLGVPVRVLLAVPEVALGGTGSVVVGWARTEALLLLVAAHKSDLENSGDDKEDHRDDRNGECGSVQAASSARRDGISKVLALTGADATSAVAIRIVLSRISDAKRGVHDARARARAMAGQDGDGDEATNEQDVEDNSSEGKEADASEAAGEHNGSDCVNHGNSGDALNSLLPVGNALVAVCAHTQEVGVDAWA